jgi:hypothetical protein
VLGDNAAFVDSGEAGVLLRSGSEPSRERLTIFERMIVGNLLGGFPFLFSAVVNRC